MSDPGGGLLDAALIRRRRLSLGITERELARELGVTSVVVHGLERGLNHTDLTVGLITALGRALALDISELFQRSCTSPAPGAEAEASADGGPDQRPGQDAAAVGALLDTAGRAVPASVLAQATGWPLERVTAALDALERALPSVGLRLHRLANDQVRIVAATANPEAVERLLRASLARTGMNLRQVQMLYRVWSGQATGAEQANSDRVALGELINAGLITYDADTRGQRPALSDEVVDSLRVDSANPRTGWIPRHGRRAEATRPE